MAIINWQELVGGALLGALLSNVSKYLQILAYIWRYFFVKSNLQGWWYSYHWTYLNNKPVVVESKIEIKKGIFHRYRFTLDQNTTLNYKGTGVLEGDHVVFSIKARNHDEKTICRFENILPNTTAFFGIWMSFDHDKKIAGGGIMFSQKKLEIATVSSIMKRAIKSEKDAILMHVQASLNQNK